MTNKPVLATIRRADGTEILVTSDFKETQLENQSIEPSKPMKKSAAQGNRGFQKTVVQTKEPTLKKDKSKGNSNSGRRRDRSEIMHLMDRGYAVAASPEDTLDSHLEIADPWESELDKEYEQTGAVASAIESIQEIAVAASSNLAEAAITAVKEALTPQPQAVKPTPEIKPIAPTSTPLTDPSEARIARPKSPQRSTSYVDVPEDFAAIDYVIIAILFIGLLLIFL